MSKKELIKKINNGQAAIIPTDTIYGLVGQALNKGTVELIYQLKNRRPDKPFIILISSINQLKLFGVVLSRKQRDFLNQYWPGKVSVILSCKYKKFAYLHRNTNSLAFRLPNDKFLLSIIKQTGPLIAPSANPEGDKPAEDLRQAKKYFANKVVYYGRGKLSGLSSTLVSLIKDRVEIIRQGSVKIS